MPSSGVNVFDPYISAIRLYGSVKRACQRASAPLLSTLVRTPMARMYSSANSIRLCRPSPMPKCTAPMGFISMFKYREKLQISLEKSLEFLYGSWQYQGDIWASSTVCFFPAL
jgi:hypothetical protein